MTAQLVQKSSTRQGGFTLIELMISIALMAAILTAVGVGLRTVANGWSKQATRFSEQDMLLRAFSLLRRDITGLQRINWTNAKNSRFIFRGESDRLQFVASEPPYPSLPGPYILNYHVQGGTRGNLSRARARFHPEITGLAEVRFIQDVPLIEGHYNYRFSYAEDVASDGGSSTLWRWHASWPYLDRLPALFRLEISDARTGNKVLAPLIVRPRVDAERACVSQKAQGCSLKRARNDADARGEMKSDVAEKK